MAYRKILISQKEYYMELRRSGKNCTASSKCSGISESTGYRVDKNGILLPKPRNWRTRQDPLDKVWEEELVPILKSIPDVQPMTLYEHLEDNYPGQYNHSILRTLQRRVSTWKSLYGNDKEVMFRQIHNPGQMGISDFTLLKGITITINGKKLNHLLYHYRLVYSKWTYVKIILGGESYTALATGLQEALQLSGGCPVEHRTDSLSAAFNNNSDKELLTSGYNELCNHYGMKASRNNPGKSHENGAIESPHGHLKHRISQALLMRRSYDFRSLEEYQGFIDNIVSRHNKKYKNLFAEESLKLISLPEHRAQSFTIEHVIVTSSSTISVKRVAYSVPSRLVGSKLEVHIYDDCLELYCGGIKTHKVSRIHYKSSGKNYVVNYRDIINSLSHKPQAFRNFVWKEEMFPNDDYRKIWSIVNKQFDPKKSCKYFVLLLLQASRLSVRQESSLSDYVLRFYKSKSRLPDIKEYQRKFKIGGAEIIPLVKVSQHSLTEYNDLLKYKKQSYAN